MFLEVIICYSYQWNLKKSTLKNSRNLSNCIKCSGGQLKPEKNCLISTTQLKNLKSITLSPNRNPKNKSMLKKKNQLPQKNVLRKLKFSIQMLLNLKGQPSILWISYQKGNTNQLFENKLKSTMNKERETCQSIEELTEQIQSGNCRKNSKCKEVFFLREHNCHPQKEISSMMKIKYDRMPS